MSITYLPQSVAIVRFEFVDGGHISVTAGKQAARHINDASIRVRMSYISISTIPCNETFACVCECVYSPLQIQSKADLLCTSQVSQGEKVCSLVFNEKPKKRSLAYAYQAAHTVPKNKRMLLQANRPRQPNSQAPMHKKRQQLRL